MTTWPSSTQALGTNALEVLNLSFSSEASDDPSPDTGNKHQQLTLQSRYRSGCQPLTQASLLDKAPDKARGCLCTGAGRGSDLQKVKTAHKGEKVRWWISVTGKLKLGAVSPDSRQADGNLRGKGLGPRQPLLHEGLEEAQQPHGPPEQPQAWGWGGRYGAETAVTPRLYKKSLSEKNFKNNSFQIQQV